MYDFAHAYVEAHDAREVRRATRSCAIPVSGEDRTRARGLRGLMYAALGNNSEHLWLWDEISLTEALGHQIHRAAVDGEDEISLERSEGDAFAGVLCRTAGGGPSSERKIPSRVQDCEERA